LHVGLGVSTDGPFVIRAAVTAPAEQAEELRARFIELAPEGFEEQERDDAVVLAAYGSAAERVLAAFPDAAVSEVGDDWADRWREFHHGIRVGPLWVGPPWEAPPDGAIAIVIDPGRAFGTGAHPTTLLCLELMLAEERGSVLDLGCGSGVLAIAAARLGFAPVVALDHDPVAVEVARANAAVNGVTLEVRAADVCADALPAAELAVANIAAAAIADLGGALRAPRLIGSGYRRDDHPVPTGYVPVARNERDGWAADVFLAT
jgi:ribosomal protein L11 methyltransferase